jgi:hypothetical protein
VLVFTELLEMGQRVATLAAEHSNFTGVTEALSVRISPLVQYSRSQIVSGQYLQMGS